LFVVYLSLKVHDFLVWRVNKYQGFDGVCYLHRQIRLRSRSLEKWNYY